MHNFAQGNLNIIDCKYFKQAIKADRGKWVEPRIPYLPYLPPPVPCISRLPHHASRVLAPFFLGFLPLALFRLQNIKYCCVVSLYFSRFLPFKNSYPRLFSSPPPVHLPPRIFPGSHPLSYPIISEPSYDPIAGKLLPQFKEHFNYVISVM